VPVLQRLVADRMNLVAVYTQPDRPSGRGRRLSSSPVKQVAAEQGLPVKQPESFRDDDVYREFKALDPDIMIVAAYGQILPARILDVPAYGCVNVHASVLPRWRGAAPVARAIEAGDATTGISIMRMDAGMDTGGVIATSEIDIGNNDNSATLMGKLAALGAEALAGSLCGYISGRMMPEPQDEALATYAPKLLKSEAPIDWSAPAAEIRNKVRALNPWPVAHSCHEGNRIRVLEAELVTDPETDDAGHGYVRLVDKRGIEVRCGEGVLRLTVLQKDHGRPMTARDFLNGYRVAAGDRLTCTPQRDP